MKKPKSVRLSKCATRYKNPFHTIPLGKLRSNDDAAAINPSVKTRRTKKKANTLCLR